MKLPVDPERPHDEKPFPLMAMCVVTAGIMISRYPIMSRYGVKGFVVGTVVSLLAAGGTRVLEERMR